MSTVFIYTPVHGRYRFSAPVMPILLSLRQFFTAVLSAGIGTFLPWTGIPGVTKFEARASQIGKYLVVHSFSEFSESNCNLPNVCDL